MYVLDNDSWIAFSRLILWFNIVPQHEKEVHYDKYVVGATFVLNAYEGDGDAFVVCTMSDNRPNMRIHPLPILAGRSVRWQSLPTAIRKC
jgi:hypothetical protein